jgi:hypothetical protein
MKMITHKKLRELYPYALEGHRKNCTCYCCGLKRDDLYQKDHPYEAARMIEEAKRKQAAIIRQHKRQVHDSEAKMTKVLRGNKSYKEDDILSFTALVEYKMVERPLFCYKHNTDKCTQCDRPLVKQREVANPEVVNQFQEQDTVNCGKCFQRIGSPSFGCPVCGSYEYVYGRMLRNPMDIRWTLPKYKKYEENRRATVAQEKLKERQSKIENPEDYT